MNTNPTRLLVSVRNPVEADIAVTAGADIIDIKDPARGSLGMASIQTIIEILDTVNGRREVTAALGEWSDPVPGVDLGAVPGTNPGGIPGKIPGRTTGQNRVGTPPKFPGGLRFVKIGLAGVTGDWSRRLTEKFDAVGSIPGIVTGYADHQRVGGVPVGQVIDWVIDHGQAGVLIDTGVKDGRGLFDWCDDDELGGWIGRCRRAGILIALAGSLRDETLDRAFVLGPDIVGVRGAACDEGDRGGGISSDRVRDLVRQVGSMSLSSA